MNDIQRQIFKKIINFNKKLNSYEYMIPNNGNFIIDIKNADFKNYYKMLTPKEFFNYKGGVCWDYVAAEAWFFKKYFPSIKFKTYFSVCDDNAEIPTHTFLLFELNGYIYWFESSWKKMCGIYKFKTEEDALNYICSNLRKDVNNIIRKQYILIYDSLNKQLFGMGCEEYMDYMLKQLKSENSINPLSNSKEPLEIVTETLSYLAESYFSDLNAKNKEFDDKPTQKGFIDDKYNHWNSIIEVDDKKYRERCEGLIIRDKQIYLAFKNKYEYKIPGGSTEPNKSISSQLIAESQEEARLKIKNIKYILNYKDEYKTIPDYMKNISKENRWIGHYTYLFICEYDGEYNGIVKDEDKDPFIYKNGKFYDINEIYDKLRPEHKIAIDKFFNDRENMNNVSKNNIFKNYWNDPEKATEGFLFNQKDLKFNVEKWGTEVQYNILYITGLSGSGKSTLSEEYAKDKNVEIIHLDDVMYRYDSDYWFNKILAKKIPNYIEITTAHKNGKKMIVPVKEKLWNDIYNQILLYSENLFKKKKKLVVEGLQIILDIPSGYISGRPLIIKGTSVINSLFRAFKRDGLDGYGLKNIPFSQLVKSLKEILIKWKVDEKRKNALAYDEKMRNNREKAIESLGDIGDSKYIIDNFSSMFNIVNINKMTKNLLSIHDDIKSFDINSLFTKVIVKNHRIEIEGINFKRMLIRMEQTYGTKKILNILGKEYNAYDEYLFKNKKISRKKMRITKFVVHEFFALELFNIFAELEDKFDDSNYRKICALLQKKTWIGNIGKTQMDLLDISKLNNLSYELQPYQKEFIQNYPTLKSILGLNGYILAFEQGLGKTLTSISLAECMNKEKVYILCPNKLTGNWADEIKAYYKKYVNNDELFYQEVCVLNNNKFKMTDKTRFIITNQENIKGIMEYVKDCNSMLIIDESHNFRNMKGSRVKELLLLKNKLNCKDILLCSGTPIKAVPSEIVPSLLMIDPIFDMEAAEIYTKCFNISNTSASNIIKTRFGYVMYRKDKRELALPEKFITNMKVEIKNSDKFALRVIRDEISKRFKNIFEEKVKHNEEKQKIFVKYLKKYSTAPNSIYKLYYNKMVVPANSEIMVDMHESEKEIISTYIDTYVIPNIPKEELKQFNRAYTEYIRMRQSAIGLALGEILPKARTEMYIAMYEENKEKFINIIENNDKKVVIFSQFKQVVDYICDDLNSYGIGTVKVTGDIKNAYDNIKRFKEDGAIDVIVATSQTMGTGQTLIEANKMFFFGPPWRSTDFDQCCDRIHRIGQTTPVYIHNVILDTPYKNLSSRMHDILNWSNDMFTGYITDNLKEDVEKIVTESSINLEVIDSFELIENKFNLLLY